MKISLNWLRDYVDIPADCDIAKLAYDLTMTTVEVEAYHDLAASFDLMTVGVVEKLLPHPDADRLHICMTDLGDGGLHEIVCGGINLYEGIKVAVARPGARVRWHGEGDLVTIKKAKVRGVESEGMICASSEIGLFDLFPFEEEATIIDLSDFDAAVGTPLAVALGLDDIILEVDNKSLTNRPDLWGHYGIAREIAAIYDWPLVTFERADISAAPFTTHISEPQLCRRYIGVRIEGLTMKAAPFAMQSRIWRVGMRPINAIVDISNYVMLATGQPTHAFDADIICGDIRVRLAAAGEKLLLLNEKELCLTADDLVIADDREVIALAGVMGGSKDSVLATTDKIILEIANFDAVSVRHTAMRHELRTESSARFEKAIDTERADLALTLALRLFNESYPSLTVAAFGDNYPTRPLPVTVDVSLAWLKRRIGKDIPLAELEGTLGRLGFAITADGDTMHITVPPWRATGDVSIPADIMEEAARLHGFENFAASDICTVFSAAINQPHIDMERHIKEYLAFRCGMCEIFSYPWMDDAYVTPFIDADDRRTLTLAAAPSPTESRLRSTLLPGLCRVVSDNLRYFDEFAIFEEGRLLWGDEWESIYDEREKLPVQRRHVAGAFVGGADGVSRLFGRAKGVLTMLPRYAHLEAYTFTRDEKPRWADEMVWLNITQGGRIIGHVGLLAARHAMACGIKNAALLLFELDIDALVPLSSRSNAFSHIPEYPLTDYDVSVLVATEVGWGQIEAVLRGKIKADGFVRAVSYVGEYRGEQIAAGKKSVTLRLTIGSTAKTLTSEEIEASVRGVLRSLERTVGAVLR